MIKKRLHSFRHASDGIAHAVFHHPNFLVHLVFSLAAVFLGVFLGLTNLEWAVLVFTIAVGLALELINTGIESVVDLVTQEYRLHAKYAKDLSAAAMLLYSLFALVIAYFLFADKLVVFF